MWSFHQLLLNHRHKLQRLFVMFAAERALEAASNLQLNSMLMDFTFNTNRDGLLLGSIGPVGLHTVETEPNMRFLPVLFVLADAEDEQAIRSGISFCLNS